MTKSLIETKAQKFDMAQYKDRNTERMKQLVEAKIAGKEIVAPPAAEQVQVLNLMDALKASVAQAKAEAPAEARPAHSV
jgi:DNA end-binding protein Ku